MRSRAFVGLGAVTLGASLALTGCSAGTSAAADEGPIVFATLPVSDDPTAENPVAAIADLLAEETGREVEVTDVPDYLAVVEAIRKGHADVALMSGFPSALAVNTGEVEAIMAWPGSDDPVSTCIVLEESELRSLSDITPETVVAFADPASSSGYFMPVYMLDEAGLEKDTDYTAMFSGGHDMSFIALEQGQVDVACTSAMLAGMYESDMFPFAEGETRSLGESPSMPVSLSVLIPANINEQRRADLLAALPKVFSADNADVMGVYASVTNGVAPVIEPEKALFQPFVDIAGIAGVELKDLQ